MSTTETSLQVSQFISDEREKYLKPGPMPNS